MNNSLLQLWKDANSPLEYLIALWITSLAGLALTGFVRVVFELITNPEQFSNITFGLIDYI